MLPLTAPGIVAGCILVFIPATRELSAAIFLYSINTQVLSVLLFDKSDEGNFEMLASIGLVLVFITVVLILVAPFLIFASLLPGIWRRAGREVGDPEGR